MTANTTDTSNLNQPSNKPNINITKIKHLARFFRLNLILNKQVGPCNPNPCMNDGVCVAISATTASCKCSPNYIGYLCELKNPCVENPNGCQNGGTCVVTSFSADESLFKCICATNFSGDYCEVNINTKCTPYTCFNRGNCSNDQDTGFVKCTCLPMFSGYNIRLFFIICLVFVI